MENFFAFNKIEFINTTFKDVFGNNEFIQSINLDRGVGDCVVDLAELPTKMLKRILIANSKIVVKKGLKFGKKFCFKYLNVHAIMEMLIKLI